MHALGIVASPRKLQQACRARAGESQRAGEGGGVKAEQLAHRSGGAERALYAGVVKAALVFQAHRGFLQTAGDFEAQRDCEQEILAGAMIALADRQCRGQHGAAGVGAGEGLAFKRADHRAIRQRGTRDIGLPRLIDHRHVWCAAELVHHLHHALRPGHGGADEGRRQHIQRGDFAFGDEGRGQISVAGIGDEFCEGQCFLHGIFLSQTVLPSVALPAHAVNRGRD